MQAGIAAERSLDAMTQANEQLRVDLEKWHEATNKEMSQLMREVADNHIGYHQKVCGVALRCDKCSHVCTSPLLSFLLPLSSSPLPSSIHLPFSLLFTLPLSPPRSVRLLQRSVCYYWSAQCFDEWEKMLKLLKNISTVTPIERDKHPAETEAALLETSTDS